MWSRGLSNVKNGWTGSSCRFSVAAQTGSAGVDDFLHSISTSPNQTSSKNNKVLETAAEFFKHLKQNSVKSIGDFIDLAQISTNVRSKDQKDVLTEIDRIANSFLPTVFNKFGVKETVDALRFILQITPSSKVSSDLQKMFIEKNIKCADLHNVPFQTIVMLIRYSDSTVDQKILNEVAGAFLIRIEKELSNPTDLLTILAGAGYEKSKWFHNEKFVDAAEKLVPIMGISEKCALLKHMAEHKQRNKKLLGGIINALSYSKQCLSVSQIVSITSSCSFLTYYPHKIAKKVAEDLEKNSNVFDSWKDIEVIADSFVRIRMGDPKSWNLLVRWATENVKQANFVQLSRFVSGLARIGEPSGKSLARALKPLLARERAMSPNAWLNTIYSLAYFKELDETLADSVLNKSFVDQIMNSTMVVHDRLRKAMTLLMISAAAKLEINRKYDGPTVTKGTFARYGINFDAKTIMNARELKYSRSQAELQDVFLKSLFMVAPQDTHCQPSNVEECGAFVDAYVLPDPTSTLLVNTSQWNSVKPRPLFFYGWLQTKQNMEKESSEANILGQDQLGLRLIREYGYDPVIVFNSEFDVHKSEIDRMNMLREKIHKNI